RRRAASLRQRFSSAVPTSSCAARIDSVGGHGAREALICVEDHANTFAHPTRLCVALSQNDIVPCLRLWARGSPSFLSFRFPQNQGGRRATRRMTQVALDRSG